MTAITSTTCAVCGGRVRVASGHIAKHRVDGHVCDNSGCSVEANDRGRRMCNDPSCEAQDFPHDAHEGPWDSGRSTDV